MKKILFAAVAALALAACYHTPKSGGTAGTCDMSKTESGDYCITCNMACGPECPSKDGVCCKCGHQVVKREWCVKACYRCTKHGVHDKPCADNAGANCCTEDSDKRRIEYRCMTCGRAEAAPGKCHVVGCSANGKALTKVCCGSGEFPHGGEAPAAPAAPAPANP